MRALITVVLVAMALVLAPVHTAEAAGDVALPSAAGAAAVSGVRYFILIDAGSTGSRAHVHEYTVDAARPLPIVEESKNKKIKPGTVGTSDCEPRALNRLLLASPSLHGGLMCGFVRASLVVGSAQV
jgi:hypothetical protein